MATITKETEPLGKYIVNQVGQRWRVRAEQALGLILTCRYAKNIINAIDVSELADNEEINDSITGQRPFIKLHFEAFKTLINTIADTPENLITVLRGLQIRADNCIMVNLNTEIYITTPADCLRLIIRPLAIKIREFRRIFQDDERIISIIENLQNDDIVDESQPDKRKALVGNIKTMHSTIIALLADSNDETTATATDAACTEPLRVI